MIRVIVLAPIDNSLYARLVSSQLLKEREVQVAGIIVRSPWNWRRFISEFNRDGMRLLRKIWDKWLKGDRRFNRDNSENLSALAKRWGLPYNSLKNLAKEHNIPFLIVQEHNNNRSQEFIEELTPDLIVFTGGGLIKENILNIPRVGILNCHTGILPQFRGMDVVEWTAVEGCIEDIGFGATLHLMDKGVDTGPILLKAKIDTGNFRNFENIRAKLEIRMVELMLEGVAGFRDGTLTPEPQKTEEGRQYYVMHPRMMSFARRCLLKSNKRL